MNIQELYQNSIQQDIDRNRELKQQEEIRLNDPIAKIKTLTGCQCYGPLRKIDLDIGFDERLNQYLQLIKKDGWKTTYTRFDSKKIKRHKYKGLDYQFYEKCSYEDNIVAKIRYEENVYIILSESMDYLANERAPRGLSAFSVKMDGDYFLSPFKYINSKTQQHQAIKQWEQYLNTINLLKFESQQFVNIDISGISNWPPITLFSDGYYYLPHADVVEQHIFEEKATMHIIAQIKKINGD